MASSEQTFKWQQSYPSNRDRPCHLLILPPELRLQIFSLILVRSTPLLLTRRLLKQMTSRDRDEMKPELLDRWFSIEELSIMLTCKQLHAEAASVLYSQNTFLLNDTVTVQNGYYCFSQTRHLKPFVYPRYAPLIRHVLTRPIHSTKQVLYTTAVSLSQLLAQWPGVTLVTVQVSATTLAFAFNALRESGREAAVTRLAVEMQTMQFMHGIKLAKGFTLALGVVGRDGEEESEELREVGRVVREAVEKAKMMRKRLL